MALHWYSHASDCFANFLFWPLVTRVVCLTFWWFAQFICLPGSRSTLLEFLFCVWVSALRSPCEWPQSWLSHVCQRLGMQMPLLFGYYEHNITGIKRPPSYLICITVREIYIYVYVFVHASTEARIEHQMQQWRQQQQQQNQQQSDWNRD